MSYHYIGNQEVNTLFIIPKDPLNVPIILNSFMETSQTDNEQLVDLVVSMTKYGYNVNPNELRDLEHSAQYNHD